MSFNRIRTQQEYTDAYALSIRDPEGFWAAQAETFTWRKTVGQDLGLGFRETRCAMVRWW